MIPLTLAGLDTEALLGLGQHQLLEGGGGLGREVRGRRPLKVSKHLLLEQLERPGSTLKYNAEFRGLINLIKYM